MSQPNVVLIGMPGAGKSTLGVMLAKETGRDFIDTDLLIQASEKKLLQDIVDSEGYKSLREIEEQILVNLHHDNAVIATGGSAVYSDTAMNHLKKDGVVVFLNVDLPTLESRVGDYSQRGIAKRPDQSFADLFAERLALYENYADISLDVGGLTPDQACSKVALQLRSH